ncbi:long-chain fatty acid transporter [Brachymonas denitrificans]|uniref:OmpP1/FadL family transporter n=1 Tax=Brachymonas denitrificans TaxID=28220 RepID=UPI002AFFA15D|nr:long-chain fatty acid transporter [Brachymonas denitrificans]
MKHHAIGAAVVLAMLPATGAFAAGLDRSGQPVAPIFQQGNLVELGWTSLFPTVEGKESIGAKRDISNMADKYSFPSAAVKYQANDQWSFSFLYDHPFGADAAYDGINVFTNVTSTQAQAAVAKYTTAASDTNVTNVAVTTQSFSLVAGFQPNKNWHLYGGPVYQTIKGDVHLRGAAYSVFNGYDANFSNSGAWGFLAGAAYQIPDIAFRAALTYRSAIKHDVDTTENFVNYQKLGGAVGTSSTTKIKTPQSVNFDLQSGVAPNTVAFANLRWVDWSSFSIRPGQFGAISNDLGPSVGKPNGFNLVEYGKDQYSATVGVGRKFSDQWAGNMSVGWDSGTGEYVTTLGPTRGNWNLGIGAQYSPTKNFYIGLGAKYFWLGDAKAQVASNVGTTTYQADFKDNNAVAVGVKVGYRF